MRIRQAFRLPLFALLSVGCAHAPRSEGGAVVDVGAHSASAPLPIVAPRSRVVRAISLPSGRRNVEAPGAWADASRPSPDGSYVLVGIGPDDWAISAHLRDEDDRGIWLDVRFDSCDPGILDAPMPTRNCEAVSSFSSPKACRDEVVARGTLRASWADDCQRVFRVEESGVRRRRLDGVLEPVATETDRPAKVTRAEAALDIDMRLPLDTLPNAQALSLEDVTLIAKPVAALPKFDPRPIDVFPLAPAITFSPNAALRARFYELLGAAESQMMPTYDPAGLTLRATGFRVPDFFGQGLDTSHLVDTTERAFRHDRTFGAVDIGYVFGDFALATVKDGAFVDAVSGDWPAIGVAERAGELHAFTYKVDANENGDVYANYFGFAVAWDGHVRSDIVDQPEVSFPTQRAAGNDVPASYAPFHAPDFTSFGYRVSYGSKLEATLTWHYDPKKQRYLAKRS